MRSSRHGARQPRELSAGDAKLSATDLGGDVDTLTLQPMINSRGPDVVATLFPDHNQSRIDAIRAETGLDDAEALARLFVDGAIRDDGTLAGRLRAILDATERRTIRGLQTGLPFLDAGFRGDQGRGGTGLRDPWPSSRNQVGHFLTAVGLAFRPEVISASVFGRPLRAWLAADRSLPDERVAKRLTVGHELAADPGWVRGALAGGLVGGSVPPLAGIRGSTSIVGLIVGSIFGAVAGIGAEQLLGFRAELARANEEDEATFDRALAALGTGPTMDIDAAEAALGPLFRRIDVNAKGNSFQDLRLSLLGWWFGEAIRRRTLVSGPEVAAWVRVNLKAPEGGGLICRRRNAAS